MRSQQILQARQVIARQRHMLHMMRSLLRTSRKQVDALQSTVATLEQEIERLRIETYTDPLTGLYNRVGMRHVWNDVALDVTAVMVIDSDHFKAVNDRYGHSTGDIVLCLIGETIRSHGIIACRTGGDEFIGLVVDPQPAKLAEKFRLDVSRPRAVNGHTITTTVTIGLCHVDRASNGLPARTLVNYLELADYALYKGKRRGRNTITETI